MGVQRFIQDVQKKYTNKNVRVLYGASNDKDLAEIFKLFPGEWEYYFTEFNSQRSMKIDDFKSVNKMNEKKLSFFSNEKKALVMAKEFIIKKKRLIVLESS